LGVDGGRHRRRQLHAHDQRFDPAEEEEEHARDDESTPNVAMVDDAEPVYEPRRVPPQPMHTRERLGVELVGHRFPSSSSMSACRSSGLIVEFGMWFPGLTA